nr:collagenase [uncultured Undibacterium sp.]
MSNAYKTKSPPFCLSAAVILILSLLCAGTSTNSHAQSKQQQQLKAPPSLRAVEQILSRIHVCSDTLSLRSEAMSDDQEQAACQQLGQLEKKFHQLFAGNGKTLAPVKHDNNQSLRANIYRNKNSFAEQAGMHFNMPVNNGGMYLEDTPERTGNHAEFVAYQREQGAVHNLGHEYIHYLDGRFNLYGDFCANLHDSHAAPENCPKPAPQTPYLVWWSEGLAEYIAHGNEHAAALNVATKKTYHLSELFDTGYEKNNDSSRIYSWGYLAVRFMLERHCDEIDRMLSFTRVGDYPRYQALVRSWGTSFDAEFAVWLEEIRRQKN